MNDRLKHAFDAIHADDGLKRNTITFLRDKGREKQKNHRAGLRRWGLALACFLVLMVAGVSSYNAYFTGTMYIDVDINPSIELTINRFNRVIAVYAYNADGEVLLKQLDLMHAPYDSAVTMLTEAAIREGYLPDGGLISVTLQSERGTGDDGAIETLQTNISSAVYSHHAAAQVDVFAVGGDVREHAHEQNLSPAKYLAILELQEVDPTATVESCRDHTIGEIRALTEEHGGGHHGEGNSNAASASEEVQAQGNGAASTEGAYGSGHHAEGNGNAASANGNAHGAGNSAAPAENARGGEHHAEGNGSATAAGGATQTEDDTDTSKKGSHGNGHHKGGHE